MEPGEILQPQLDKRDHFVVSGDTKLAFQVDGNLVLYKSGKATWTSGTRGSGISRLTMQPDGNLVVYGNDSNPYWASDTAGHPGASLVVGAGDARVVSRTGQTLWSALSDAKSGTKRVKREVGKGFDVGHAIAKVSLLGVGVDIDSNTWVANAVKTSGRAIGKVTEDIQEESGKIGHALSKIPVVGGLLEGIYDGAFFATLGPMVMTNEVLFEGARIDQVALAQLKTQLKDFKEIGPYAQMVCSFIPGVGQGIAAAIGCGLALANGQPLSEAILAGVEGALPGGPLAKMAFDVARAGITSAIEHKPITWKSIAAEGISAAASAISLPDAAKNALEGALTCGTMLMQGKRLDKSIIAGAADALPVTPQVKSAMTDLANIADDVARGQRVDRALLAHVDNLADVLPVSPEIRKGITAGLDVGSDVAQKKNVLLDKRLHHTMTDMMLDIGREHFPDAGKKALSIGMAVTHGSFVQGVTKNELVGNVSRKLMAQGQGLLRSDSTVATAYKTVVARGHQGFQIGAAMMRYRTNVHQMMTIRQNLSEDDRSGFDLAVSLHTGRVASAPPTKVSDPKAEVGYYLTRGMMGGYPTQKQGQMAAIADHPVARVGAEVAITQVAWSRKPWWERLLIALGFKDA
jgi:hypothetical protein